MNIKCVVCGRFISYKTIGTVRFTPDSEVTIEKIEHFCEKCTELVKNR